MLIFSIFQISFFLQLAWKMYAIWLYSFSAESSISRQPDCKQPHGFATSNLSCSGEKHYLGNRTSCNDDVLNSGFIGRLWKGLRFRYDSVSHICDVTDIKIMSVRI